MKTYILTLIGNDLEIIKRLTEKYEIISAKELHKNHAKQYKLICDLSIKNFLKECKIDFSLEEEENFMSKKKMVIFDMDSTLIQQEVIDEIAKLANIEKRVSVFTKISQIGNNRNGNERRHTI